MVQLEGTDNRGLTKENTKLSIISPIGYFKSPIGNILSNQVGDLFSDSALPDFSLGLPRPWTQWGKLRGLLDVTVLADVAVWTVCSAWLAKIS